MDAESLTPATEKEPSGKRSPRERALVWGAIAALLVIVVFEWSSQRQFQASLTRLERAIEASPSTGRFLGIPRHEVETHIDGITFRDQKSHYLERLTTRKEEEAEIQHELIFRWPSLFKKYQLIVTVNSDDRAILVAADIPSEQRGP